MIEPASTPSQMRRRRLLFRATHRGTHETDLLVGGFISARLETLTDMELDTLEQLLDLPDPDLADWLTGRLPIPPQHDCVMLRTMREAALAGCSAR